jgi:hypothetical protein
MHPRCQQIVQAYNICKEQDRVPEMVFLLGRMGNNKQALTLIIERLGDVHRVRGLLRRVRTGFSNLLNVQAIDFAKEQNDHDLWEDLLKYAETRPGIDPHKFSLRKLSIIHLHDSVHPWVARERWCRN